MLKLYQRHQEFPLTEILRAKPTTTVLEIDQVARLCVDGVYSSPCLRPRTGVLVSTGAENFDIAVAEDVSVAFLGADSMNYPFRVFESLVLRIKRPTAICTLE